MTVEVTWVEVDVLSLRRHILRELELEEAPVRKKEESQGSARVVRVMADDGVATKDGA